MWAPRKVVEGVFSTATDAHFLPPVCIYFPFAVEETFAGLIVISCRFNFHPNATRGSHCLKTPRVKPLLTYVKASHRLQYFVGAASRQMPAGRAPGFGRNFSKTLR